MKIISKMSKLQKIKNILKIYKSVVVAYSGGLDSAFLLKMAVDTLGSDNVLAVTAQSETYPDSEYQEAKRIARKIGCRHIAIATDELKLNNFKNNPYNRCYYCKRELFRKLDSIRKKYELNYVADGTNYDDLKDIRYGRKAARELGVKSPLLEARITKDDIRRFSKRLKLPTWDKPALACLASRIPFGEKITKVKLSQVEKAEGYLKSLGFIQVRVRLHKNIARLEFYKDDFGRLLALNIASKITSRLKRLGFKYVTLDLEGYRTGSMH